MSEQDLYKELWELSFLVEDLVHGGWERPHPEPPTVPGEAPPLVAGSGERSEGKPTGGDDPARTLGALHEQVRACNRCDLARTRRQAVPGTGRVGLPVMVVGEAPGADEDVKGEPFVGRAGQYLDKWLAAIGLQRGRDVFITNVVKCRPPGNRDPRPDEISACLPFLEAQIALVRPRAILTVGRFAASTLLGTQEGISRLRGRVYRYRDIPLVPTYHPSAVLRDPSLRRPVWEDLKLLSSVLRGEGAGVHDASR
ncbi:phage SPO1 DNA polymerase-related protein [Spirochaeta thermophila DSM 6578]|uniref:Type-4 uracil-DNA glycosylase n=1 Tax=Winmispira thermophila (strain ATCC 700085 / DSM 6578 / Z-1203) TaxID=869211 RepID=G0GD57_WINT7|nr:uracil-DNA glycosylase [Spirochaeta thermophila]AEJ62132.1 phage SPO1 DNA polymerase-related protein [Spirochaeta thermophila DSM 6578]